MKVRVLWFGRVARGRFEPAVEEYRRRVCQRWPAEDVPLKPAAVREHDPRRALAAEAATVRARVPASWSLVALDEAGRAVDSQRFAWFLRDLEERGLEGTAFVVGSDLGLDTDLIAAAAFDLSLSPLTLPHQLARLLLWEQLYRATDILSSGVYHRLRVE